MVLAYFINLLQATNQVLIKNNLQTFFNTIRYECAQLAINKMVSVVEHLQLKKFFCSQLPIFHNNHEPYTIKSRLEVKALKTSANISMAVQLSKNLSLNLIYARYSPIWHAVS